MLYQYLFFFGSMLATVEVSRAKRNDDSTEEAIRNMQIGMQGLAQAGKDPALLAQLMEDMQDAELMAEAKKMMESPEFQKQMKDLQKNKDYKDTLQKSQEMLKDPNTAAYTEAKMEHMLKVGNERLKKDAGLEMEAAMEAAINDPNVRAEMQNMMKDKRFQDELAAMTKDPKFQKYIDAMQDMMMDPGAKKKLDAMGERIRASL